MSMVDWCNVNDGSTAAPECLQGRVLGPQEERFRVDFGQPTGVKAPRENQCV